MGKAWQTSNRNDALSKIGEHQDTKSTFIFSGYKGLMITCRTASVLIYDFNRTVTLSTLL
jgi:hypothetical protein